MRTWPTWLASTVGGALLCALPPTLLAQIQPGFGNVQGQTEAQSWVTQSQAQIQAGSHSSDTSAVADITGDTSTLQSYGSDAAALSLAGASALPGDQTYNLLTSAPTMAVTSADSWLQKSYSLAQNPQQAIATSGDTAQQCSTTTTQQTVTSNNGTYTCESSQAVTDSNPVCAQTLVVNTSTTYFYQCEDPYDQTNKVFTTSPQCAALSAAGTCAQTGSGCAGPANPYFQATQCTQGVQWTSTPQSCQAGTGWSVTNPTCDPVRQVVVDANYVYNANRNWNGVTWAPDAPETALQNAGALCQVQATNCTSQQPPPTYQCTAGYTLAQGQAYCVFGRPIVATRNTGYPYVYSATGTYISPNPYTGTPALNAMTQAQLNGVGNQIIAVWTSNNCVTDANVLPFASGGGMKMGLNNLDCQQPLTSTMHDGVMIWSAPDQATMTNAYQTWGYGSLSLTNSVVAGASYLQGSVTGTVGLPAVGGVNMCSTVPAGTVLTRATLDTASYPTTVQVQEPGCSPPQGYTQTSSNCVATDPQTAQCIATAYVYTGVSGGCQTWQDQWLCTAPVTAAGAPISSNLYVASDTWSNACSQIASTPGCSLTTSTVTSGPGSQVINGLSVYEASWALHDTYSCNVGNPVNTCTNVQGCSLTTQTCRQLDPATGLCALYDDVYACWTSAPIDGCTGNVTGCTQTGRTCSGADSAGNCSVWLYNYSCPADDGSGNCSGHTYTYSCSVDVPAADPFSSSTTVQTGQQWQPACPAASDPTCQSQGTVCTDGPGTRIVNGISVTETCWGQTTTYACQALGAQTSDCNPPAGCTHTSDNCLDTAPNPDGTCVTMDHVYSCSTTSTKPVTNSTCAAQMCLGTQCFTINGSADSNDIGKAYSALALAQISGASFATSPNLLILGGAGMGCRKDVLGFLNCCQDSGWGPSLGLASCNTQEKTLIQQQKNKACHYVGTYCSKNSFFGVCLQKKMQYCCFDGPLARIVNEAGRPQVGKTWGTTQNLDCSGFTVAQFQRLDLSNVDFSDFYNSALSQLAPNGPGAVANIQSSLQNLYGSQSPTNLTPGLPAS